MSALSSHIPIKISRSVTRLLAQMHFPGLTYYVHFTGGKFVGQISQEHGSPRTSGVDEFVKIDIIMCSVLKLCLHSAAFDEMVFGSGKACRVCRVHKYLHSI